MERPVFPAVKPEDVLQQLFELPVQGRLFTPKKSYSCEICRRAIHPLGRVLTAGVLTCNQSSCETISMGDLAALFPTPYGRALTRSTLRTFTQVLMLETGRLLVQAAPVRERAEALVGGYRELVAWQRVYDDYDHYSHYDKYERGIVTLIPPRRLEDVLAIRAFGQPEIIDPTLGLKEELRIELKKIKKYGSAAVAPPF